MQWESASARSLKVRIDSAVGTAITRDDRPEQARKVGEDDLASICFSTYRSPIPDLPSLRSRVTTGTILLLLLVFGMTLLGVNAINSLSAAVRAEMVTLRERNVLAQAITHDVVTAVRAGDAVALHPD